MVFAYALKTECNKLINIRKIVEYIGTNIAMKVLRIHAVKGCDTNSLLHGAGKIKLLTKCLNGQEKLMLLNATGISCKVSDTAVKDVQKFIQTVCYSGKEEKSLTETRVRLYKQINTKVC